MSRDTKLKILILAGDGIGPEVTQQAINVLRSVADFGGYSFQFSEMLIGGVAIKQQGSPLPTATLASGTAKRRPPGTPSGTHEMKWCASRASPLNLPPNAARRSLPSTKPTCSKSLNSGAQPSPRSLRNTPALPSN